MEELKLNAINKAFGFPTEAVKPPSIDDVTRDILKVIQNPETLRAEQSKEIQHRYGQIFIDHWLRKQELRPIRVHPEQGPLLFLNSKKALPVPTEENFSVRDNLIVALEAVNNLLREQFLKSLKSCPHSNPLSLEVANSNHTAALRVGTHYHFFAAETITENFDQAKENINPKVLKTRKASVYRLLAEVAASFEFLPLFVLDAISTYVNKNPFTLDKDTNRASLKPEVLNILYLAGEAFKKGKQNGVIDGAILRDLTKAVLDYSPEDSSLSEILEVLDSHLSAPQPTLHSCPALDVSNGSSGFRTLFEANLDSFLTYHSYLGEERLDLTQNSNQIFGPFAKFSSPNLAQKLQRISDAAKTL